MAINVRQPPPLQPIRTPSPADGLAGRRAYGGEEGRGALGRTTELPQASRPGEAANVRSEAAVQGAEAPPEPAELARAVEEANALAETLLRATNRTVTFGRDEPSGRVVIRVREEAGDEVELRQIPSEEFLRLVARLRAAADGGSVAGTLIDLDR